MLSKRAWIVGSIAALAIVLAIVYYCFDPAEARWMPRCLWKVATDTDCPGCGSQRMAHALMHGDISGAWHANAFALCIIPLIGVLLALELNREKWPNAYRTVHSPWVIWILAAVVLVWWIVRNLV